jgi:hypothetical protein
MLDLHVIDYSEGSYIRRGGARYNLIASGAEVSAALALRRIERDLLL